MTKLRKLSAAYGIVLLGAASLNYVPGLTDADGRSFGIFELDMYDDLLHLASAVWAFSAAAISHRAARAFLLYFGILYLGDGLLGLATGSGYLDLGILNYGIQDLSLGFKVLANLPHLLLGSVALAAALTVERERVA